MEQVSTPPSGRGPALPTLDLLGDPVTLTADLVDIPSPSGHETLIADAIEASLRNLNLPGVEILRFNNNVLARTHLNLPGRVILAGIWIPFRSPTTSPATVPPTPTAWTPCTAVAPWT